MNFSESGSILIISSYPPRECGIANFTQDLASVLNKKFNPVTKTKICAVSDSLSYDYDCNVLYQLADTGEENYISLAQKINNDKKIKIVNIQHEFGLFGGKYGNHIVSFIQNLNKPVVTTFHTVTPSPKKELKETVKSIAENSEAIVIMNKISEDILRKDYDILKDKIYYIPHGIPQIPYESSKKHKKKFKLENKTVLSTFGLMSKNKGIEYVLKSLPRIIKKYPSLLYLIIGKTHPIVKKREGEKYRNFLKKEIKNLKLENHVRFYDKYFSLEEIIQFLQATDIYIYPSVDKNQSVSGTLSYALGAGRPSVSAKTVYAKHILNKDNGILVNIKNPKETAKAILSLISDKKTYDSMSVEAYKRSREMIWPNIAQSYFKLYKKFSGIKTEKAKFPEIKFNHIKRLTDSFGIIQHAKYANPNKKFGYSSDDMARALLCCCIYYETNPSKELEGLMDIYLRFLNFVKRKDGSFSNIVSYSRKKDNTAEEDVLGRIIWALGFASSQEYLPKSIRKKALTIFKSSAPLTKNIKPLRSVSFALTGLYFYLKNNPDKNIKHIFLKLSDYLSESYKNTASPKWRWFENCLTYSNSKLSEALFYSYEITKNQEYLKIAEESLSFLDSITLKTCYIPIGQKKWYFKNKKRCYFDQQPEDAASMVQTKIMAFKITKNKKYLKDALKVFSWFFGKNHLKQMVYNEATGGCYDGLSEKELNLNQGAESTISYLLARLSFEDREIKKIILKL